MESQTKIQDTYSTVNMELVYNALIPEYETILMQVLWVEGLLQEDAN